MKLVLKSLVVIVFLVVLLGVGFVVYVDTLAKDAIENGATQALGVETTLGKADVGILGGTFSMGSLNVANPEGYDADSFLTLGDGSMAVSFASLRQDVVELPTLNLNDIEMSLQRKGGKANYDVILDNLEAYEKQGEPSKGEAKRFIIRTLTIRNINVHVDLLPEAGEMTKVDIPVEEITLTDVGSDTSKGMLLSELSGVILKTIMTVVVNKGGDLLPADLLNDLESQLGDLEGLADIGIGVLVGDEGLIKGAGQIGEDVGKELERTGKEIGEKVDETVKDLGNIFKKKDEDN